MNEENSIPSILIHGLIYPAVLGSIFYSVFDLVDKTEDFGFLFFFKLALFLVVLAFFCCDYVYTVRTNPFEWSFFLIDIFVVCVLYVLYDAINLGVNGASPDVPWISGCCMGISLLYYVWDKFETDTQAPPDYLKKMFIWQVSFFVANSVLLASSLVQLVPASWLLTIQFAFMTIFCAWFWWLLINRSRNGRSSPQPVNITTPR